MDYILPLNLLLCANRSINQINNISAGRWILLLNFFDLCFAIILVWTKLAELLHVCVCVCVFFLLVFFPGLKTIKGALAMPLMIEGYRNDLIKFAIVTCRKPE